MADKDTVKLNKMGTEPVPGLLLRMSWPAILSMTIAALYNVVDSIFVSWLSTDALTGLSYVLPIQLLMISVAVGTGVGTNSLIARRLGARRYDEANLAAETSIWLSVFSWIVFLLIGLFVSKPFVAFYTNDEAIFNYGTEYLTIVTTLSFCLLTEITLEKILQATGNMIAPMIISMSGCITNMILDPIMIFGKFGMPRMEVRGAALATVIGQAVSLMVAILIIRRQEHAVTIRMTRFRVNWEIVKDIYAVGFPSMVMQSIGSVMLIGYNWIISATPVAVAVLGVYFKIESFVFMPLFGLQQGALPLLGFNFGARNKKRMEDTFKVALLMGVIIMTAGTLLFQIFPEKILGLFDANDEMMRIGVTALREISICFIPAAFGVTIETVFQATGHGMYSLMGSVIRQLIGILPLAYILYNRYGIMATWYSFPIAELIGLAYMLIMLFVLYEREIKNLDQGMVEQCV
ncbi:MAG: MATE family efflux transporter [Eubacterium sp.]|nr:MATE family efflux transporter [Eubacterium sp.]